MSCRQELFYGYKLWYGTARIQGFGYCHSLLPVTSGGQVCPVVGRQELSDKSILVKGGGGGGGGSGWWLPYGLL